MAAVDKADRVRAIFAAYLAGDRRLVEAAFADDFRFTSPYDDNIEKATYFERCWSGSDWIERHELERIVVSGDEVFVTYRCVAQGRQELSQYRVLRVRRRQGRAYRRLFRRDLP